MVYTFPRLLQRSRPACLKMSLCCWPLVLIPTVYCSKTWMNTRCASLRSRNPSYNTNSFCLCPLQAKAMPLVGVPQTAPLTASEIGARRKVFSRFWSEHELPTLNFRSLPARTALETAAGVGDVQLFDQGTQYLNKNQIQQMSAKSHRSRMAASKLAR